MDDKELTQEFNLDDIMKEFSGSEGEIPAEDAIRACTRNPAAALGVQGEVGSIAPGKRADFVVCSPDFAKKRVYFGGKLV